MKITTHKKTHSFIKSVASVEKPYRDTNVYYMDCKDGSGVHTVYNVFPGIDLIYQELESASCAAMTYNNTDDNILEINHCHEGRAEYRMKDGSFIYLGEGDMFINSMRNQIVKIEFPLKYYKGFTVIFYVDKLAENISQIDLLNDLNIDFDALWEKFLGNNQHLMIHSRDEIEHIFKGMYSAPKASRKTYFKLKMLELLVFLNFFEVSPEEQRKLYFQQQVETIKHIHKQIIENPNVNYTIEALSRQNFISPTTLKTYYKEIYGIPIAADIRTNRMKQACKLLSQSQIKISDIAREVGYNSPSKFAAAFNNFTGISPSEYRKKVCQIKSTSRDLSEHSLELCDRSCQALAENQSMGRDITELKLAEENLISERDRLYSLLDTLPAYVCLIAPDYTIRFTNINYRKRFGEVKGRLCHELYFNMCRPCRNCMAPAVFNGNKLEWEWVSHKNGIFQVFQYPFYDADGTVLMLELFIEITERKHMEDNIRLSKERIFKSFDDTPILKIYSSLRDMRCLDVSDDFLCYTGYSREELIDTALAELNVFDSRAVNEVVQKVLQHGSCSNYEILLRKKSGDVSTVLLSAEKAGLDGELVLFSISTNYYRLKMGG